MAKQTPKTANKVFRLKITLAGSQPPIWRRILVSPKTYLDDLHYLLQDAMGWTNSHLHEFIVGGTWLGDQMVDGTSYGRTEYDDEDRLKDETAVTLGRFLKKPGQEMAYLYDLGDCWTHRLELEEILADVPESQPVPYCLAGERACPPDDSGGVSGYERIRSILADPTHREYADMVRWIGMVRRWPFDPEAFDLADTNKAIREDRTRVLTRKAMREGW